jgi:phosphotransferase system HPr (HPr) family protein
MSASSEQTVAATRAVLGADLHARPAAEVNRLVSRYDAEVLLLVGARSAKASSVLAVMALGARAGEEVEVRASGPDALRAVADVVAVLEASEPGAA